VREVLASRVALDALDMLLRVDALEHLVGGRIRLDPDEAVPETGLLETLADGGQSLGPLRMARLLMGQVPLVPD
jgi:hypothetical protein